MSKNNTQGPSAESLSTLDMADRAAGAMLALCGEITTSRELQQRTIADVHADVASGAIVDGLRAFADLKDPEVVIHRYQQSVTPAHKIHAASEAIVCALPPTVDQSIPEDRATIVRTGFRQLYMFGADSTESHALPLVGAYTKIAEYSVGSGRHELGKMTAAQGVAIAESTLLTADIETKQALVPDAILARSVLSNAELLGPITTDIESDVRKRNSECLAYIEATREQAATDPKQAAKHVSILRHLACSAMILGEEGEAESLADQADHYYALNIAVKGLVPYTTTLAIASMSTEGRFYTELVGDSAKHMPGILPKTTVEKSTQRTAAEKHARSELQRLYGPRTPRGAA